MLYAIYSDKNGDILRLERGMSPPEGEAFVAVPSGTTWQTPPKGSRWRIVDGAPAMVEVRTLNKAKGDAWDNIKAQRSRRLNGTFTHAGKTYDIDQVGWAGACIDAREAITAGETGFSQLWVLANNNSVTLSAIQVIAAGRACRNFVSGLLATSQNLRGLIEAAATIPEVEAVTWP